MFFSVEDSLFSNLVSNISDCANRTIYETPFIFMKGENLEILIITLYLQSFVCCSVRHFHFIDKTAKAKSEISGQIPHCSCQLVAQFS